MKSDKLKSITNRIRGSHDAKALLENFISLSALKVLGFILPLVTLPYLSRVIGVGHFGDIAFANSIIVYFMTIMDYGFNYTATRDLSKNRDDREYVRQLFWNVFYTKSFLLLISILIFIPLVEFVPLLREHRLLLWFTFLSVPCYMLFPEWYFQGMEKMKYITMVNVISRIIFTVLIFIVIKESEDYVLHPLLSALGLFVAGMISLYIIVIRHTIYPIPISWKAIKSYLHSGWDVFVSLIAPNLYSSTSTIFLQSFHGGVGSGLFSSGRRFADIADQMALVVSRVFFPFLARRPNKHHLYGRISLAIQLTSILILILGADLIISLFYTEEFAPSANVLRIMAVSLIFMYLSNTYGTNYLLLHGMERQNRQIVMYSSIIGLAISYVLVWKLSYIGAALTFLIVRGAMGVPTWILARKYMKNHPDKL